MSGTGVDSVDISDPTSDYIETPEQVRHRATLAATGRPVRVTQHWERGGGRYTWEICSDDVTSWAVSEEANELLSLDTYSGMFRFLYHYGPHDA